MRFADTNRLSDSTLYEAEDIPVKVRMNPHKCASDPRLKLDLRSVIQRSKSKIGAVRCRVEIKSELEVQKRTISSTIAQDRRKVRYHLTRASSDALAIFKSGTSSPVIPKPITFPKTAIEAVLGQHRFHPTSLALRVSPKLKKHIRIPSFKSADNSPHRDDLVQRLINMKTHIGYRQQLALPKAPVRRKLS